MTPTGHLDTEACYRAVQQPGPPLRRGVLHRGPDHRHLLPALVPGAHPGTGQRHLPPHRSERARRRLPRLQALPARRDARQPRVGRRRRRRRAGDAPDRRRSRRPRGCRRAGPPGRLHPAPPRPAPDPGARRGPAGAGPGPSRPERAGAHRDHRPAADRRRVRGRLRQRPPVQRDPARDLRRPRRASCAGVVRAPAAPAPVTMRLPVRTPFAGRRLLDFLAYHLVPGVEVAGPGWYARTLDLPHGTGTVRLELADLRASDEPAAGPASSPPSSGSTTCATPRPPASAYAACSTPTATRARWTTTSAPTRCSATSSAPTPGLRVPGPGRRRRDRDPHGHRPAGQRHRRPHGRRTHRGASTAAPSSPTCPD